MSYARTTAFEPKVPSGQRLYDFQRAGVEYLLKVGKGIDGDAPGCGKTPTAIATMNTAGVDRYLVLCPASLCDNWHRELTKWSTGPFPPHVFAPAKRTPRDCILIMSYGLASREEHAKRIMGGYPFGGVVCDEFHALKNMDSQRSKTVLAYDGFFSRANIVLGLSGTPLVNRPIEIFAFVNRINPRALGVDSMHDFGLKFCQARRDSWGWVYDGADNREELGRRLRSTCMVRRLKKDVLPELPPKIERAIYLDKNEATTRLVEFECGYYDAQQKHGSLTQEEQTNEMRVRIQLGLTKVRAAVEYIRMLLTGGVEKLIVFGLHRDVLARVLAGVSDFWPVIITGATPQKERQPRVDQFQNDPRCRVLLGCIQAAGVGFDMTAANYVVFVESSWVPGENEQASDRPHRIGQRRSVSVDYLIYSGSVDERVLSTVGKKARTLSAVLNT